MEEKGKRVVFEYESSLIEHLQNQDALEWLDKINGMCILVQNREQNPFSDKPVKWKTLNLPSKE